MPSKCREKRLQAKRKWKEKNPEYDRWYHIERKYNLSKEQWFELYFQQKGLCYICRRHQDTFTRPLHVDHCHKTGKIRGLLCMTCNNFLGYINEDEEVLKRIIDYLREPDVFEVK